MITRVLCVFARADRGGEETMCMNLYRNIDRSKVQFDFVKHTEDKCDYDDEIVALGGKIYSAPKYKIYNHLYYENWWGNFLKSHPEYKIIHAHYSTIAAIFFKIAKKYGVTTIAHSHTSAPKRNNIVGKIKNYIAFKVTKYADYRFACGIKAGKWLYKDKDFTVLNNAIDTASYKYDVSIRDEVRNELNIGGEFVVGTVGRITESKNPYGIVDIFHNFHKVYSNSKLVWCGSGDLNDVIKRKVHELGLDDGVSFLGIRTDVNRVLQAVDAFIMPSFYEGLPVSAVEAQAAGLPCLFSTGVSKETDITGDCDFISLDDVQGWTDALLKRVDFERKSDCSKIIDAGYDIHITAKWLEEFYLKVNET